MKPVIIFGLAGVLTAAILWFTVFDNRCSRAHTGTTDSVSTPRGDARGNGVSRDQARVVIPVEGMTCGGCASAINLTLKRLDGVLFTEADPEKGTATVIYQKDKLNVEQIVEAINKTGFKARPPDKRSAVHLGCGPTPGSVGFCRLPGAGSCPPPAANQACRRQA